MAMVQMQALACGLPLICTTHTGGEDLLRLHGEASVEEQHDIQRFPAGFLIPIHSPEAIAWCLRRLQMQPGLWEKQRQSALELAQTSLSWSDYGDRAIELYSKLLR